MTKSSLKKKEFIWFLSPSSGEGKAEAQGKNLEAGPKADAVEEHCFLIFLYTLGRTACPRMVLSTKGWIKKMLYGFVYGPI